MEVADSTVCNMTRRPATRTIIICSISLTIQHIIYHRTSNFTITKKIRKENFTDFSLYEKNYLAIDTFFVETEPSTLTTLTT